MRRVKIVVTGGFATGKTQLIHTISDIAPITTDYCLASAKNRTTKQQTTVALDFGTFAFNHRIVLHLYGTPGKKRFDVIRDYLIAEGAGSVVLVDSCRPASFAEAQYLLVRTTALTDAPFIVAANKQDIPAALPIDYIRQRLSLPRHIPLVSCVATDRAQVQVVITTLLKQIVARGNNV